MAPISCTASIHTSFIDFYTFCRMSIPDMPWLMESEWWQGYIQWLQWVIDMRSGAHMPIQLQRYTPTSFICDSAE